MDEQTALSVAATPTRADYKSFSRLARRRLNILPYALIANAVAMVATYTINDMLSDNAWMRKHVFENYGALYYAGLVVFFVALANFIFRIIGRNIACVTEGQDFLRPKQFRMNEKGVYETSRVSDCFYSWAAVTRIEKTRQHILFYTDTLRAMVIPLRSFAGANDAAAFLEKAQAFRAASADRP
jgi:hypothetical protein